MPQAQACQRCARDWGVPYTGSGRIPHLWHEECVLGARGILESGPNIVICQVIARVHLLCARDSRGTPDRNSLTGSTIGAL